VPFPFPSGPQPEPSKPHHPPPKPPKPQRPQPHPSPSPPAPHRPDQHPKPSPPPPYNEPQPEPTKPANEAPDASFTFAPDPPRVGQTVTFTSVSRDSDGSIESARWDLDGDGKYDDARGAVVRTSFKSPGDHKVRLQVVDDRGARSTTSHVVSVRRAEPPHFVSSPPPPPVAALPAPPAAPPASATRRRFVRRPLNPFPIVRARGRILRGGVVIDLLSVRAAPGTHVTVRCHARRCPVHVARAQIGRGHHGVRVRRFEHWLPTGAVLQIFVTRSHQLGKYTRFRIRAGMPPARTDLCVRAALARPIRCPF